MAIVPCVDCGHAVSAAAVSCPHCGRPRLMSTRVKDLAVAPDPGSYSRDDMIMESIAPTEHAFFPVSTTKFVLLSLSTLGLYEVYWCYKNWERIQKRTNESLSPLWRAVFAPLWGFALFGRMRAELSDASMPVEWNASILGGAYLIVSMCWRLPGALWLTSLGSFVAFIPVVQSVRRANRRSDAQEGLNESYSTANVLTIALGGLLLMLAVLGTFMETPGD